jgi:son of sevenless-like protein
MSAILTALSSVSISRLLLTWAHSARKSHLDSLLKYNEPTGKFGAYRIALQSAEGPCVPFITMLLTDIVHVEDQVPDTIPSNSETEGPLICFTKRQRWYDIVTTILRHQSKMYNLAEDEPTKAFVITQLKSASAKDQEWFWVKSQEVQQLERAHADIRKGLEAAGF